MVPLILNMLTYLVLHITLPTKNNHLTNKVLITNRPINKIHNSTITIAHQILIFKGLQIKPMPSTQFLDKI